MHKFIKYWYILPLIGFVLILTALIVHPLIFFIIHKLEISKSTQLSLVDLGVNTDVASLFATIAASFIATGLLLYWEDRKLKVEEYKSRGALGVDLDNNSRLIGMNIGDFPLIIISTRQVTRDYFPEDIVRIFDQRDNQGSSYEALFDVIKLLSKRNAKVFTNNIGSELSKQESISLPFISTHEGGIEEALILKLTKYSITYKYKNDNYIQEMWLIWKVSTDKYKRVERRFMDTIDNIHEEEEYIKVIEKYHLMDWGLPTDSFSIVRITKRKQ